MMVTEHYLSAEAGLRMLHAEGNAFDAAVAATLAEGVLNPHMHTFRGRDLGARIRGSGAAGVRRQSEATELEASDIEPCVNFGR